MQHLQPNTTLQGGKYTIIKVLGQGGFGITYLAENTMLDGKVAIKEFFFKEYCDREEATSHVAIPTSGNREIVERFRHKFIKEARTIFRLNHPNIVSIHDIFEENGTAYYVMDYIEGESLGDMVKRLGAIPEVEAVNYIKEVGKALSYIHSKMMTHLDIKPGNIMRRKEDGKILVIDFGVAKQYDIVTEKGTTTTPVGISAGYSPSEQYKKNGVGDFSPQSDVYSLAATLFKLLTGITPPEAMEVMDDGLPVSELRAKGVSQRVIEAIENAMQTRNKRTQSVDAFIADLDGKSKSEETSFIVNNEEARLTPDNQHTEAERKRKEAKTNAKFDGLNAQEEAGSKTLGEEGRQERKTEIGKKKGSSTKMWIGIIIAAAAVLGTVTTILSRPSGNSDEESEKSTEVQKQEISSKTFTANGVSFEMMNVQAGTFIMGATPEMKNPMNDEKPTHKVTLTNNYYIGKTEVTQALWKAIMGSNPSSIKGDDLPVECVSWYDCIAFISKLNDVTGENFRLPTEAEWEYAARGGKNSNHTQYSGSSDPDEVAWSYYNNGGKTHDVASKQPNELGIYDMSGNVGEWCNDWYGSYSYNAQTNPTGPSSGSYRVNRGGSWGDEYRLCSTSCRRTIVPDYGDNYCGGFRLALSE